MKKLTHENRQIHPEIIDVKKLKTAQHAIGKHMETRHERSVLYWKLWSFRVRAGVAADAHSNLFSRDYEVADGPAVSGFTYMPYLPA